MNKLLNVVISQSNYIPWVGYFYLIDACDSFVFLETVQYTRRDWRNRNQIKTPNGQLWLTIPVQDKFDRSEVLLKSVLFATDSWRDTHLKQIHRNYKRSSYFHDFFPKLERIYAYDTNSLSKFNVNLVIELATLFGLQTVFHTDHDLISDTTLRTLSPTERLIKLTQAIGGSTYSTTKTALNYLDTESFAQSNIKLNIIRYPDFSNYQQLWGGFMPNMSILDFVFNNGETKVLPFLRSHTI